MSHEDDPSGRGHAPGETPAEAPTAPPAAPDAPADAPAAEAAAAAADAPASGAPAAAETEAADKKPKKKKKKAKKRKADKEPKADKADKRRKAKGPAAAEDRGYGSDRDAERRARRRRFPEGGRGKRTERRQQHDAVDAAGDIRPVRARTRGTQEAEVVVIGAGLAGLNAARSLAAAGVEVVVVEARDRVGGRTESRQVGRGLFDVGGQWMGPTQDRMARLVRELGVHTFPTHHRGTKLLELEGRLARYQGSLPAVSLVALADLQQSLWRVAARAREIPLHDPRGARDAVELDRATVHAWSRKALFTRQVRKLFDVAHRVVFGAEPAELSMLQFLFYSNAGGGFRRLLEIDGGAQHERFVEGAQEIAQRMADRLGESVVLGAPVRALEHSDDRVVVRTDTGSFVGRRAIVAVPPALAARIDFDPVLPAGRQQLLARLPMGSTVKVLVAYERAFWREAGYSGEVVCADGPLTVVFDNTSHEGAQPALLCFLCGRDGRRWAARAATERRDIVLSSLVRYFGAAAREPEAYVEKNWDADPFSGGCPVASPGPGVLTGFADSLRDPIGRIHWAGTETASVWNGYMEGALESGERAAHEVLAHR